jgi:hypothetical protein
MREISASNAQHIFEVVSPLLPPREDEDRITIGVDRAR